MFLKPQRAALHLSLLPAGRGVGGTVPSQVLPGHPSQRSGEGHKDVPVALRLCPPTAPPHPTPLRKSLIFTQAHKGLNP